jgi:hypothetical protein
MIFSQTAGRRNKVTDWQGCRVRKVSTEESCLLIHLPGIACLDRCLDMVTES